ncbi:formate C-acetyltransferase/glycerol dehydratase family glycyl radical enzyme [Anaerosacchariphilus sp. NSJ-68]|uniref:Formate C-acetyltransferase/glycerol dehydratase family glycyl radical enzyme n=2 Tax=Lachnospiraceae TaxID=186803 RepID=A0A923RNJ1_9FIRM|nr:MULTISPECIES: formate C-acetyltransferase/glycerol dehydratase family glycyl radical enzyme [Lachnospiraceae]MBC5660551.1 formate C-acetyltransferase/glycerol dehydratase family glycyl radical enzyme [Anaerosacchariphilus hominis]MBC5699414.1 formate C-acetyltransferase/glycerol dehydratase family glycyl radical enzyme [Roseburia difficilis]
MKKLLFPEGITRQERTEFLNARMRAVVPEICVERARLVTESYQSTEGEPYILRRAKALRHLLEHMTIFIDQEELIVGNHAAKPRCAPVFPEFGLFDEKELDLMPVRKVDTLQISEEDKRFLLDDIFPYWKTRCAGERAVHYFSPELLRILDSPYRVFNPLSRTRSGHGHYLPNVRRILQEGFVSIEEKAARYLKELDYCDPDYAEKMQFYQAALICIDGVKAFQKRYAELARSMAADCTDERRKKELSLIAANCDRVPYQPARTYFEAVQSFWFVILIDYCGQNGSSISDGRVDQILRPYYEKDLADGVLSRDEAGEILECLWVKHSDIIKAGTYSSVRNNGGFSTANNLVLGGLDPQGNDAVCDMTYLCLEAEEAVFNSEPNTSIRLSSKNPDAYVNRVIQILVHKEGGKMPFFNDDQIIDALMRDGLTREEALDYAIVGCVEPTGYGNTMGSTNAGMFNLAKCLELALFNGVCQMSGMQMGPKTGYLTDFKTFEEVQEAFRTQVTYFVNLMVCSLNCTEKLIGDYCPHIFSSLLLDGCLENGRDCTRGGAKYNHIGINGVGTADVADSLNVIRHMIYETHSVSAEEVMEAMRTDFKDKEILRQRFLNQVPKYGNDVDAADHMAVWVAKLYCDCVRDKATVRGGTFRPGLFCLSSNTPLGRQVCALPSGRLAGTPLGDGGISPKHSMDTHGPTAAARSVAKLPHTLAINGVNFNMKFLPSILKTPEDQQKLTDLIRTYFSLGGMHIQFNILTREKLIAAQKHPDKYRSLVVRVAGYSAFFVELDKDIQDEIISRTEHGAA